MKLLIPLFIFVILLTLVTCKKEQVQLSELNTNCDSAEDITANFLIEDFVSGYSGPAYSVDTDTIFQGRGVRFTALEKGAKYEWVIRGEIINERIFVRDFQEINAGESVKVSLTVYKKPNNICLPDDDGIDSATRLLVLMEDYNSFEFYNSPQSKWEGTFRMLEEGENDSIDIKVYLGEGVNFLGDPYQDLLIFQNLNGNNDSLQFRVGALYNMLITIGGALRVGCLDRGCFRRFYDNNTYEILIPRDKQEFCSNRKTYHFKGRKLN